MSIAFLGAMKSWDDEELEQALSPDLGPYHRRVGRWQRAVVRKCRRDRRVVGTIITYIYHSKNICANIKC